MTNTIGTIFTATSAGITNYVDAWVGIGVVITLALAGYALAAKFLPRKKKVV